jgi:hypothetical protein
MVEPTNVKDSFLQHALTKDWTKEHIEQKFYDEFVAWHVLAMFDTSPAGTAHGGQGFVPSTPCPRMYRSPFAHNVEYYKMDSLLDKLLKPLTSNSQLVPPFLELVQQAQAMVYNQVIVCAT